MLKTLALALAVSQAGCCLELLPSEEDDAPAASIAPSGILASCGQTPTYQPFKEVIIDPKANQIHVSMASWNSHMGWALRMQIWSACVERTQGGGAL